LEDEVSGVDPLASMLTLLIEPCTSVGRLAVKIWACEAPQKRHSDRNILIE